MHRTLRIGCSALALVAVLAAPAHAQSSAPGQPERVSIGGFWSANVATARYLPKPIAIASRQWNGGGVTVDVPIGASFSLDTRAMWNRRGAKLALTSSNSVSQEVFVDYVSLPVLFKAAAGGSVRAYAVAGPEIGIRLRSRAITTIGSSAVSENANDATRRTDLLVDLGAGIERNLQHSRVFVEALYSHGLKNVLNPEVGGESAHTRTLTLLAGVRF